MIATIVIGATFFLGSHIVDALTRPGEHVLVLDQRRVGKLGYIANAVRSGRLTYAYIGEMIDAKSLRKVILNSKLIRHRDIYYAEASRDISYSVAPDPQAILEIAASNGAGFMFTMTHWLTNDAEFYSMTEQYRLQLACNLHESTNYVHAS